MQPRFITFEGGEGAGKSTQLALLDQALRYAKHKTSLTREPGGSVGGEAIRKLVVSGSVDRWDDTTEALLFMTARYDHIERLIKPALADGKWVLCDRFYDSTYVYQGMVKGVDTKWLDSLYTHLFGKFAPDCTMLLDLPADVGLKRATSRGNDAESRFERMGLEFHTKIREAFNKRAATNEERFIIIDASAKQRDVHVQIIDALNERYSLDLEYAL